MTWHDVLDLRKCWHPWSMITPESIHKLGYRFYCDESSNVYFIADNFSVHATGLDVEKIY